MVGMLTGLQGLMSAQPNFASCHNSCSSAACGLYVLELHLQPCIGRQGELGAAATVAALMQLQLCDCEVFTYVSFFGLRIRWLTS